MTPSKPLGPLPEPAYEVLDPRFTPCVVPGGLAERLWTGGGWTEGPVWFAAGYLLWSDIPNNNLLRWDAGSGACSAFRQPSSGSNGNTLDREGRLITCEHYSRRVSRTEADGSITTLAANFNGKRFNAPNDVVVKSDGTIWFTDPSYGGGPEYEGTLELQGCHVYRLDPATGDIRQMTYDMVMPNGLAFSLDERQLYVVDTGSSEHEYGPNHIRRFDLGADGGLSGGAVFATSAAKAFDGIRFDNLGRLWCSEVDGAHCYASDGTLIGKLKLPEPAANLTFGPEGWMMITATTSLYRVPVNARRP